MAFKMLFATEHYGVANATMPRLWRVQCSYQDIENSTCGCRCKLVRYTTLCKTRDQWVLTQNSQVIISGDTV